MLPTLIGDRVTLRPLVQADAAGLHEAYGDAETMRFWDFPPSRDLAETEARVARVIGIDHEWVGVWSVRRKSDDAFIGMVNYHHREPWNHRLELGWILARAQWRQGFMGEALGVLLPYVFGPLDTHRVEATIHPDNAASRGLAEHLGFIRESGVLRDRIWVGGVPKDVVLYALFRPEAPMSH